MSKGGGSSRPVIRTEAIAAIAERLRRRPGDPTALLGGDCPACGTLGASYSDDQPDAAKAASAAALATVATPERGWSLLECTRCGALFRQWASGPPAADDLFEKTVHLTRISATAAIALLPTESPYAVEERTVAQVLALLLGGACFLNDFDRVQTSRQGEERYIFFDEGAILDAWHVQATDSLGELTWCTVEEFRRLLPILFPRGAVGARLVGPIERVPAVVREQAPLRYRRIQEGLRPALEKDDAAWILLHVFTETQTRRRGPRRRKKHSVRRELSEAVAGPTKEAYLRRAAVSGWQYVSCEAGRVTGVKVDPEEMAERRLDGLLREKPGAMPLPIPPPILERLRRVESGVVDALARLEAGEGCAHPLGVAVMVGARFAVADIVGDLVRNLVALDRTGVLDHLASGLSSDRGLTFVPLSAAERDRVAALLDPDARWDLFQAGRLVVGGGFTTDMQWTLSREGGGYRLDRGGGPEAVDEARARGIVRDKRYGWLRAR